MSTLTKKEKIYNDFSDLFEEVMSYEVESFNIISKSIKEILLILGTKILENWISEKINKEKENKSIIRKNNNTGKKYKYKYKDSFGKTDLTVLGEITINRVYYYNHELKEGLYPIEEKYPFLKDYFLSVVKELICYTSCLNPFELTHEILKKLSGINISTAEIHKTTKKLEKN